MQNGIQTQSSDESNTALNGNEAWNLTYHMSFTTFVQETGFEVFTQKFIRVFQKSREVFLLGI